MLLLALLLCVVSVVNGSLDGRIVGGNDATEGKYVYQVSIRYGSSHICGGSIINSRHVLTAAHCIYRRNTKLFRVVAGTNYLNKGGVTYSADALIWPINYDSIKIIHDIGLIRLDRHIEFNSRIRPVILPSAYYVPEGETAVVTGWGRLNATDNVPVTLQELSVLVISQTLCEQYYWGLWKNNICTYTKKDEGVCYNHSSKHISIVSSTMRTLAVLLYIISSVSGSLDERIVGGVNAAEGKYPYVVRIMYNNSFACGGTIINNRHILTAAQCIYGYDPKSMSVVAGTYYLKTGGVTYFVNTLFHHTAYNNATKANDIGIIRLNKTIGFGSKIQPILLPCKDDVSTGSAVISSWGWLNYKGQEPVKLQTLDTKVLDPAWCVQYHNNITRNNICSLTEITQGFCYGDAGSPLVSSGVQIGITSYSKPCATGVPIVHTRVYPYMSWIQTVSRSIPVNIDNCKNNGDVKTNATNRTYLNIRILLSLVILTLVPYSYLLS